MYVQIGADKLPSKQLIIAWLSSFLKKKNLTAKLYSFHKIVTSFTGNAELRQGFIYKKKKSFCLPKLA